MGCPAVELAGHWMELAGHWMELDLSFETEISGRALADRYHMGLGGLWWSSVLNLALPSQRLRSDTRLEHQDPVSHMAQKKRENKRKRKVIIKNTVKV